MPATMNRILWQQDSPRSTPVVPYLCANQTACLGIDDFEIWLTRQGSSTITLISNLELATKSQACLYFGLLSVFFGDGFAIDDFLVTTQGGQTLVDSSKLWDFLDGYVNEDILESCIDNIHELSDYGSRLAKTLSSGMTVFADFIVPRIKQNDDEDGSSCPWSSGLYSVYCSIDNLMDTLYDHLCAVSPIFSQALHRRSVLLFTTHGIAQSLPPVGRCTSMIRRLNLTLSDAYQPLSLPADATENKHCSCSLQACAVFNINQDTYEPKHANGCNIPSCCIVRTDHQRLIDIVDDDYIPLVFSSMDPGFPKIVAIPH